MAQRVSDNALLGASVHLPFVRVRLYESVGRSPSRCANDDIHRVTEAAHKIVVSLECSPGFALQGKEPRCKFRFRLTTINCGLVPIGI